MENFINSLTKSEKMLIIVGAIVVLVGDLGTISNLLIIACILTFIFFKRKFLKIYLKEYTKEIDNIVLTPILFILASNFFYQGSDEFIRMANNIDSLHNISTYTPFFGEIGQIVDIANQNGLFPEIERSESTLEYINSTVLLNNYSSIGVIIVISLALAIFYGLNNLGKFTKKHIYALYGVVSVILIIWSIILGNCMNKLTYILSENGNSYYSIIAPIFALIILGINFKHFYNSLEKLFR